MSLELRRSLFEQLDSVVLVDPHSHINPLAPASNTLADILGYHYYTELAHSAGLAKHEIEEPGIEPQEKVRRIVAAMAPLENTIQYSWFIELSQKLFGFPEERVDNDSWESLYDMAAHKMQSPDWAAHVLSKSNLEAVFLTNDFDDALTGFDTNVYIPCLRTDDLVFHFAKPQVRERLQNCTGVEMNGLAALHDAVGKLFEHFTRNNARACAISLPPDFSPTPITAGRASTALAAILSENTNALESHQRALSNYIFWLLADYCRAYELPFDLMIGVNRGVYEAGVYQGRDLYDSRVSLHQYKKLFNSFPEVTFPISVLASVTNQELTSYAWIFPNVVTNGHWWYSNTPTFIEHDLAARLEAVPSTKQIGYYSDMYKLEFGLPKFAMYKRILAKVLAEKFVDDRGWSEDQAVHLGRQILRGNVDRIFMQERRQFDPENMPQIAPPLMPVDMGPSPKIIIPEGISKPLPTSSATFESSTLAAASATLGASAAAALAGLATGEEPPLIDRNEFMYKPQHGGDEEETEESMTFAPPEEITAEPTPVFQFGEALASEEPAWEEAEEIVDIDESALDNDVAVDGEEGAAMVGSGNWATESEEPLDLIDEEVATLDTDFAELDNTEIENAEFPDLDEA